MNLLPKSYQEFGESEYWNKFFKKRGKKAFEWYGEYPELCEYLHKYIKIQDNILNVGCGNSKLTMDLYDVGYKSIANIDISQVVIRQMLAINKNQRPDMKFQVMDATATSFSDEEFSVILDKGTLDALMTEDNEQVIETAKKYCGEILRILRNGGRFICISLLQEHILKFVVNFFPQRNCMLRIVRCFEAEQKTAETSEDGTVIPVFILVITKFKSLPVKVLEVGMGGEQMLRLNSESDVILQISAVQKAALVCNGLSRGNISDQNEISIDLCQPNSEIPRYTVYILDQPPARGNGKYAAFIVPQGREVEWLFSTPQGRKKLLSSAQHNRLAIVAMHRDQTYAGWASVKDELTESIRNFAPKGIKEQIPYLSLGSDVGKREIIYRGTSKLSGDFIVEEIEGSDNKTFRRLIFLSNQFVIQSEALVKKINLKKNLSKKRIDIGYLACQHHLYMTVGAHCATQGLSNKSGEVLVIGLGGGGLCAFIHEVLRNVTLTAVEIDPTMLQIAEKFFDLKQDDRLKVFIEDGIKFLKDSSESNKSYDAILFDVDSKDLSLGMSCPPKDFLDTKVLSYVKIVIGEKGIFVLNLVCRDEKLREDIVNSLKSNFISVCSYKLDEDVNEILFCQNQDDITDLNSWKIVLENSSRNFNRIVRKLKVSKNDMVDVNEFLNDLKI